MAHSSQAALPTQEDGLLPSSKRLRLSLSPGEEEGREQQRQRAALPSQDSLAEQLDAQFPMSQDASQQRQQQQAATSQDMLDWMEPSQEQPRARGQALSALTLLDSRRSGGSFRRGSVCSSGSQGGSQAQDMGVDSPAAADGQEEVTSPLKGGQQQRRRHQQDQRHDDRVVICIDDDEPENKPAAAAAAAAPAKLPKQTLQRQAAQRSTSPKLSRFFGQLLPSGPQQPAAGAGGSGTQQLLSSNSRLLHSSLRLREEEQQQQQVEGWQGAAEGSPPDPLDVACGGAAAAQQDPIHSISHIRQFAMLASSAINAVQSSCFLGSQGGGSRSSQKPVATAAAAAASSKATQAAGRHSLLSKPFRPPRQQDEGGGSKGTGRQRKPGVFNKFLFTQ